MDRRVVSRPAPQRVNRKRIGRKAIACGRIAAAMDAKAIVSEAKKPKFSLQFTRVHAFILVGIVVLSLAGFGGWTAFSRYQAEQQRIADAARLQEEKKLAERRQECFKSTIANKADQVGKVTYDELYGDTCK